MSLIEQIVIQTNKEKEVLDITSKAESFIQNKDFQNGIIHINVLHTTTAITTADLDPGTDLDMLDAFYEIVPKLNYRHPHNPKHTPDHILSTMIGTNTSIPVKEGKPLLGTWQRIVLFEFDGPQDRNVVFTFVEIK